MPEGRSLKGYPGKSRGDEGEGASAPSGAMPDQDGLVRPQSWEGSTVATRRVDTAEPRPCRRDAYGAGGQNHAIRRYRARPHCGRHFCQRTLAKPAGALGAVRRPARGATRCPPNCDTCRSFTRAVGEIRFEVVFPKAI